LSPQTKPSQCLESELSHLVRLREKALEDGLHIRSSNLGKYISEEFQKVNNPEIEGVRRAVRDFIFDGVITIR